MLTQELMQMHIDGLNERIEMLRKALDFYAAEYHFRDSWIDDNCHEVLLGMGEQIGPYQYIVDRGNVARDALNKDDKKAEEL